MTSRFCRYELRTTHVDAASAFYAELLGRTDLIVRELPVSAQARGAPPHWLGYLSVAEQGGSVAALQRWNAHGAMPIGARVGNGAVVRDPGGAALALTDSVELVDAGVALHVLHTPDAARAAQLYAELFGWVLSGRIELGAVSFQQFAWRADEPSAGLIGDIAGRPGVHPQWQYFFGVSELDAALAIVRKRGGLVIGPTELSDGSRVAACDDPQGAAFGLIQRS
jgi:predicted enzyme related to lactoylglutathione lyase